MTQQSQTWYPQGFVAPGFEAVREQFAAVTEAESEDYAAQLAVYLAGERVVDLWRGRTDPRLTRRTGAGVVAVQDHRGNRAGLALIHSARPRLRKA